MDKFWGAVLLAASIWLPSYATYRLGRHLERRDLTAALVDSVAKTYDEGTEDGYKQGYKLGYKAGQVACFQEEDQGRY